MVLGKTFEFGGAEFAALSFDHLQTHQFNAVCFNPNAVPEQGYGFANLAKKQGQRVHIKGADVRCQGQTVCAVDRQPSCLTLNLADVLEGHRLHRTALHQAEFVFKKGQRDTARLNTAKNGGKWGIGLLHLNINSTSCLQSCYGEGQGYGGSGEGQRKIIG